MLLTPSTRHGSSCIKPSPCPAPLSPLLTPHCSLFCFSKLHMQCMLSVVHKLAYSIWLSGREWSGKRSMNELTVRSIQWIPLGVLPYELYGTLAQEQKLIWKKKAFHLTTLMLLCATSIKIIFLLNILYFENSSSSEWKKRLNSVID